MHLVTIAQLALLPIAYIGITIWIALILFRNSRTIIKVAFVLTMIAAPIGWLANGYSAFQKACSEGRFEDISTPQIENIDGFLVRPHSVRYDSQAPYDLLMQGQYKYLEREFKFKEKQGYTQERIEGRGTRSTLFKDRQSRLDFEVIPPQPVSRLFEPGFKVSRVRVVDAKSSDVKAQATEYVYGGGLIGRYIAYFANGGNQGSDTYGCGYVDRGIHLFRPTIHDKQYLQRDREFILTVLPPSHSGK